MASNTPEKGDFYDETLNNEDDDVEMKSIGTAVASSDETLTPATPSSSSKLNVVGFAFGVTANILYSLSHLCVKTLYNHNPSISAHEIIYWKSVTMILYNYTYIRQFGITVLDVPPKYRNAIVFRALIGFWGL